jgi:hypothetical protein
LIIADPSLRIDLSDLGHAAVEVLPGSREHAARTPVPFGQEAPEKSAFSSPTLAATIN